VFNKKLEIFSNHIPINFCKNFFQVFPNNLPNYFKHIPKNPPFFKFRSERTLKTCSGIINYYKKAVVFLSPFDMEFLIENNQVTCTFGNGRYNGALFHPNSQFLDHVDNKKYLCISKLCFDIFLKSDAPLIITNSTWTLNDFEILPGVMNAKQPLELNLFLPIKKEDKNIFIKQNTPLCVIHLETEKEVSIIFNNNKYNSWSVNGLNYVFSSLKNKLLKNKFK